MISGVSTSAFQNFLLLDRSSQTTAICPFLILSVRAAVTKKPLSRACREAAGPTKGLFFVSLKSFYLSCSRLLKLCISDDQAVDLLLGSRCLIVLVNDFLKTCLYVFDPFFLHIILIRINLRLDDAVMVADKNFSYQTVRAESVFQLLRRYVFSILCNDQVFLSSVR